MEKKDIPQELVPHALALASHAETPPAVLSALADVSWPEDVRRKVAEHKSTPTMALVELANVFPDNVCKNPILQNLKDVPSFVQEPLAHSKLTPPSVLELLSDSFSYSVRRLVAMNLNTAPETLRKLAGDRSESVRLHAINSLALCL